MKKKEYVQWQLSLLVERHRKTREKLLRSINMRCEPIETPESAPPPSPEKLEEIARNEKNCQSDLEKTSFAIKILRWVMNDTIGPLET